MPTINRKFVREKPVPYKSQAKVDIANYYNSIQWTNLRRSYIKEHPLCDECLKQGIVKAAEHVHHIIPFMRGSTDEERWTLLTDVNNLQSLCIDCHHAKHRHKLPHDFCVSNS